MGAIALIFLIKAGRSVFGRNRELWSFARGFGGEAEDQQISIYVLDLNSRSVEVGFKPPPFEKRKGCGIQEKRADQLKGFCRETAKPWVSSCAGPSGAMAMTSSQRRPNSPGM